MSSDEHLIPAIQPLWENQTPVLRWIDGRLALVAYNEGGCANVGLDLLALIRWARAGAEGAPPDMAAAIRRELAPLRPTDGPL